MMKRIVNPGTVVVKFVGDDDVIENITNHEPKKLGKGKKKSDVIYDHIKADVDDSSEEIQEDDYEPSTALCTDDVEGQDVYQVAPHSHKKGKKQLQKVAAKSKESQKRTPKRKSTVLPTTPKQQKARNPEQAETPSYSLRKRLEKVDLDDPADSDLENSNEDDNSWDDINNSDEDFPQTAENRKQDKIMRASAEDYFGAHKQAKSTTSNRTLSKVELPRTNVQELFRIMRTLPESHAKEKEALSRHYGKMFEKWCFLLKEGCSILLYGLGSKFSVIQNFCTSRLDDELYLVVNGFFPSLTVKQILNFITEDILDHDGKFCSIYEHSDFIKNHFTSGNHDLYIVIHNIDGPALRGMKTQSVLSTLASVPHIHFLASVDHINCALIWDQIMLSQFKWIWYEVPTYEPYILETSYENSMLRDQSSQLLLSSLTHVFHSLTTNGQGVFLILVKYQLEKKESSYLGMTFHEWYQECREAFLVNSELTMNAQLSEFKNHKLLASRKSLDGVEYWYIPADNVTLTQFLEKEEIR